MRKKFAKQICAWCLLVNMLLTQGNVTVFATEIKGVNTDVTGDITEERVPAESIVLSEEELEILTWDTIELRATVNPSDFTDEVVWTSSDESIIEVWVSEDEREKGCLARLVRKGYGEVTVTATVSGVSASCKIMVPCDVYDVYIYQDVLDMHVGGIEQLEISVQPDYATNKTLEFASSDESVAVVDENGVVTAVGEGTAIIEARATDGSGCSDTCEVNVGPALNGLFYDEETGKEGYYINSILQKDYYGLVEHNGEWYYVAAGYTQEMYCGVIPHAGAWYYVCDGKADFSYTGIARNEYGWWRIENGIVNFSYNGLAQNESGWWYIENGKVNFEYNGLASNEMGTWFIQDGKVNFDVNTVEYWGGDWYYFQNGCVQYIDTVAPNANGWWRIENGRVNLNYNGLAANEIGWWYIIGGKVDFTYTGIASNEIGCWKIDNGQVNFNFNGLANNEHGWWFFKDGLLDFNFEGIVPNENGKWAVYGGKINFEANGLVPCGDGWYYFIDGKLCEADFLMQNDLGWWYVQEGEVDFTTDTVVGNDAGWWYVEDGKINFAYDGIAQNDLGWWYIQDGKVDFGYSGVYKDSEGTWYFQNGKRVYNLPIEHYNFKYEKAYRSGDTSELTQEEKELFAGLKNYLDYAYQFDTLYEQELAIHDYMLLHCEYDSQLVETGVESSKDVYRPRGVFVNGVAVCDGYARAFLMCMEILGIPCERISSAELNHAWNAVWLEGEWYLVDVTWDDPVPDEKGRVRYDHFNLTDEEMGRYYGDIQGRTEANGTRFSYMRMQEGYIENAYLYYVYVNSMLAHVNSGETIRVVIECELEDEADWFLAEDIYQNEAKAVGATAEKFSLLGYTDAVQYAEIIWRKN